MRSVCQYCKGVRDVVNDRKLDDRELWVHSTHCTSCGNFLFNRECQHCKDRHLDAISGLAGVMFGEATK